MAQTNGQNEHANDQPTTPEDGPGLSSEATQILKSRLRPSQLASVRRMTQSWIWHGYLGPGKMTLLTSQWKSGKTTLVSILLKRMAAGGELAGLAVTAGRAAVFTEESSDDWEVRHRKLQLADHVSLFCCPFRAKPTVGQWRGLIEVMLYLRRHEGLDLVVIDPLSVFLPGNDENTVAAIMESLLPLRDLTAAGLSVLLVHHPRKGVTLAGQSSRGSGALPSHVDIVTEMTWYGKADEADRRRWLRSYSRHEETRRHLIVELNEDGTDYLTHEAGDEAGGADCWDVLCMVLEDAHERLTQRQILEQWPEDFHKPDTATISRTLKRGLAQGKIRQRGSGRKNDPYCYWLPHKEDEFNPGPNATPEQWERFDIRHREKFFAAIGVDPKLARHYRTEEKRHPGRAAAPAASTSLPSAADSRAVPAPAPADSPAGQPEASLAEKGDEQPPETPAPVSSSIPTPIPEAPPPEEMAASPAAEAPAKTEPEPKPDTVTSPAPAEESTATSPPSPTPPSAPPPGAPWRAPPAAPKPDPERWLEEERRRLRMWPRG